MLSWGSPGHATGTQRVLPGDSGWSGDRVWTSPGRGQPGVPESLLDFRSSLPAPNLLFFLIETSLTYRFFMHLWSYTSSPTLTLSKRYGE